MFAIFAIKKDNPSKNFGKVKLAENAKEPLSQKIKRIYLMPLIMLKSLLVMWINNMLGKPIPPKMREQMSQDPAMKVCMRKALLNDHSCEPDPLTGKLLDWEHALTFAGSKINEPWAIISICWLVHRGGKLNKEINRWIALNRATDEELKAKSKAVPYLNMREHLNKIYGKPKF